jgi:hypothetical protein
MKSPPYKAESVAAVVGAWSLASVVFAFLAGLVLVPVDTRVPGYAMESVLVFRLEHALALAAILILPALIIGPLLSGVLPKKLSSQGIDWEEDRANVVTALQKQEARLDEIESALKGFAELNNE